VTLEEYIKAIKEASGSERQDLVRQAIGNLHVADLHQLRAELIDDDPVIVADIETAIEQAGGVVGQQELQDQNRVDAERQRVTQLVDEARRSGATEGDIARIVEANGIDTSTDDEFNFVEPVWILDQYGQLTDEQKLRVLQDANEAYGQDFETFEELAGSGFLSDPTQEILQFVESAVLDVEWFPSFEVPLASGDLFTVRADEWETTRELYGVDETQLTRLVQLANNLGLKNGPNGRVTWQPFLAVAKAAGVLDRFTGAPGERESLDEFQQRRVGGLLGDIGNGLQPGQVPAAPAVDPGALDLPAVEVEGYFDRSPGLNRRILEDEGLGNQTLSTRDLVRAYNEGMEMFEGDVGMAYVYALDPYLARRLAGSKGDITQIDGMDMYRLSGLIAAGGFKNSNDFRQRLVQQGYAEADPRNIDLVGSFLDRLAAEEAAAEGRSAGGSATTGQGEAQIRLPDPAAVDETLRSLYQQLFDTEPSGEQLSRFRSQINGAVRSESDNLSGISIDARARQFARDDPRYADLYGNRPENVTEEQYAGQFGAAQQSMLGNELAGNVAKHAGMRSGQYQTSVGAAAGTEEAWDNSTFLGRLAQAGQIVGENT
jgi:hypothetical protein